MLDRLSVPRRALDFEDYIDILRRNMGWVLGPIFLGLVVSTVVAYTMEDTYVSSAILRIVPQQISQKLVENVTSQDLSDHIAAMAQMVKSRNTLTNLIATHHLYQNELKGEPVDDILSEMSDAIGIQPAPGALDVSGQHTLPAIQVSFSYRNKYKAQAVTADIVSRFINEQIQESSSLTDTTTEFMQDRFNQAKQQLDQVEQKLAEYRQKNVGRLPDDVTLNISQMNALESQLGALNESRNRNYEQRMMLESNLGIAQDRLKSIQSPAQQVHDKRLDDMDQQIQQLRNSIAEMKNEFTESYPDLQAAQQQLALLQKRRDAYSAQKVAAPASGDSNISQDRLGALAAVKSIETQLKANDINQKNIERDIQKTQAALGTYQNRLAQIPEGEKEYSDLLHQQELDEQQYNDLRGKLNLAMAAGDLQRRKQGQTLEIIESASLPDKATAPNREKIIPIGAAAGLVVGLILVAVREIKDTSLKNLKDARLYTQLPILGSIPLLENDLVVQRRKQIAWVGWATATLAGLAIIAGSVAHYYLNKA